MKHFAKMVARTMRRTSPVQSAGVMSGTRTLSTCSNEQRISRVTFDR